MKTLKKLICLLLAALMLLALTATAFADEIENTGDSGETGDTAPAVTYSITINNSVAGYTYAAYQIFKGDLDDKGTLSNIDWGSGVTADGKTALLSFDKGEREAPYANAAALAEALEDSNIGNFAEEVGTYLTNKSAGEASSLTGSSYVISGLEAGYYLVKNTDIPTDADKVYNTSYILRVVKNVTVDPKVGVPETEKKIVEDNDSKVVTNEASIGDTINYEITGTLPTNLDKYSTYYYKFTDTLSKGLTYKEDTIKVTVDGVDLTKYFYVNAADYDNENGTTITVAIADLLALNLLKDDSDKALVTITKESKVVVTYSATLNENAVVAGDGNTNDVKLTYSNDPTNNGTGTETPPLENPDKPTEPSATGTTPKDTVATYTTELTILKTDDSGNVLTGAEFTLTGDGVKIVLVTTETFTENTQGEYYKLANGTYTTTAPTDIYDSLTTKYSIDSTSGKYTKDTNGTYWKLKGQNEDGNDQYTEVGPENLYDSTAQKYSMTQKTEIKNTSDINVKVVGSIDEGGHVTFTGLGAGKYTITETKTPAGYNTIAPITFTVTFDADTKKFASDNNDVAVGADNKLATTVINEKGSNLPSTGGVGTTVFYVLGSVLMVGAGVLLVVKKRMSREI